MNPTTIIEIAIVVIAILAFILYLVWQIKKNRSSVKHFSGNRKRAESCLWQSRQQPLS